VHVLAVGGDDGPEHHDDGERDPRGDGHGGQPGEGQGQEDLVRGVGDGGQRVGREHRERDPLREQGVAQHLGPHRPPDEEPFRGVGDIRHENTC